MRMGVSCVEASYEPLSLSLSHLTGFKMLIKPTFEHADAFSPRVESDHDLKPNNETNQPPVRQQRKTTIALMPRAT